MPIPRIDWQDLTDDELNTIIDQVTAERLRRWHATRPLAWLEDIRARMTRMHGGVDAGNG